MATMHVLGRYIVAYLLEQAFAFVLGGLVFHFHGPHSVGGHLFAALNLSEIMIRGELPMEPPKYNHPINKNHCA